MIRNVRIISGSYKATGFLKWFALQCIMSIPQFLLVPGVNLDDYIHYSLFVSQENFIYKIHNLHMKFSVYFSKESN
jgi:hypothetical protein